MALKVDYRGPKDSKWRHGEEDLKKARQLLEQGDSEAQRLLLRRRMMMREEEKFERDLAVSLGAWTRAAEAEGRVLMRQAEELVERARGLFRKK